MNKKNNKKLYRFETFQGKIVKEEYEVLRETKHYFIIDDIVTEKKVSKSAGAKNYAYENENNALRQFFYRKRRQVELLERFLKVVKRHKEESFEKLKENNINVQFFAYDY